MAAIGPLALVAILGAGVGAARATPIVPIESITIDGGFRPSHGTPRGRVFAGVRLSSPAHVTVSIHCTRCSASAPTGRGFVSPQRMRGLFIPAAALLRIRLTRARYIGRYIVLAHAGTRAMKLIEERCLAPGSVKPVPCPPTQAELEASARARAEGERAGHERAAREAEERERLENERAQREQSEKERLERERVEHEHINRQAITSVDGTLGDRAPYENVFSIADQPFEAWSSSITYVGVTVANPALPVGPVADKILLRVCDQPDCSGAVLASASVHVNNYGLTTASLTPTATITPFQTYYLVWAPPTEAHGGAWLTFWHAGTPYISGSLSTESVVRGNDGFGEEGPRAIISYDGAQPTPAPYTGPFDYGFQGFKAASDTITQIGVVVGNPGLARGSSGVETIQLRLCETSDCSTPPLASATPYIVNYGVTVAGIGEIAVKVGQTYFINWLSPRKYEGHNWESFWLGQGPKVEEASLMQAFAKGYDRSASAVAATYYDEQSGYLGSPTFSEPVSASGGGPRIAALEHVQVSCRVFAPQIESAEPGGYWYRIHSPPWNDAYYAVANTFWNGVGPGEGGEPVNTDFNVPDC